MIIMHIMAQGGASYSLGTWIIAWYISVAFPDSSN